MNGNANRKPGLAALSAVGQFRATPVTSSSCKPRRIGMPVALISLVLAGSARAHMTVEGVGEIASGALHPVMTPAHALVLLALGLLLGQQVPLDLKIPLRVFAPLSAVALLLTTLVKTGEIYQPLLIGLALVVAVLVGLEKRLPWLVRAVLCGVAATGIGLDSGVETGSALVVAKTLLGTWFAMNAVVLYLAICASHGAGKHWACTGIRIIGSWIVAICLMVLAFHFKKHP